MGVGESQWVSMETGVAYASCAPHKGLHHPDKGLIAADSSASCVWALPRPVSALFRCEYFSPVTARLWSWCQRGYTAKLQRFVYLFHHTRICIPTVNEWFIASLCAFSSSSILTWMRQFCAEECAQAAHAHMSGNIYGKAYAPMWSVAPH